MQLSMCLKVTQVFILSTLGLFDFSVVQVPNTNLCRLAETGSSQRHLSKFEAIGFVNVAAPSSHRQFYLYREEDGVKKYVKVGNRTTDYRLSVTLNEEEKSIFVSKARDGQGSIYDVMYRDPSTGHKLYLQGIFPLVNGTVDHSQAYARVGHRNEHYNISGNVVPLSAIASSNTCGHQAELNISNDLCPCPN